MTPAQLALLIQAALSIAEAVEEMGGNFQQLRDAQKKARELGRDLTTEELTRFQAEAQAAIDAARPVP